MLWPLCVVLIARIRDTGKQSGRQCRTVTGDIVEQPAGFIGSVPSPRPRRFCTVLNARARVAGELRNVARITALNQDSKPRN